MTINLELDVNEVNTILQVLAKAPYDVAAPLIEKIRTQGQPQVTEEPAEA
jgi:hypothetical protein